MFLTAVPGRDQDGGFVAGKLENGMATQRETIPDAASNLQEVTEIHLEDFPED